MYSYQHRYHSGSIADVHKHIVLINLLVHLQKKASPFCVLDSHAGEGLYNLHCPESQKIGEYRQGILPLWEKPSEDKIIVAYKNIINNLNTANKLVNYPGSPKIIQHFLRAQDSAILIDGHPTVFTTLKENFKHKAQFHLHQRDALEGLKGLVPFKEKRGLIFIDPSYEVKTEFQALLGTLTEAYGRFEQGIYAIWYPLLEANYHHTFIKKLHRCQFEKVWHCQWKPYPDKTQGMVGSGMIIINTPWQCNDGIAKTFTHLNEKIYPQGQFFQEWLSNKSSQ